jgi:DNA-binding transcriptional MerR regulator
MDERQYLIDELCGLSGFSRRTVRYYVQEGLVDPPAGRGRGGYYSERQVRQLARIRELQEKGFRLEAIRAMLGGTMPSAAAPAAAPGEAPTAEPAARAPATAWTRIVVAPGVELHLSAEAELGLGREGAAAVRTALEVMRSAIENKGGSDE